MEKERRREAELELQLARLQHANMLDEMLELQVTWVHLASSFVHRVSKKTPTHIIGYKLRSSCPILIIFDIKIPHIIWHRMTA